MKFHVVYTIDKRVLDCEIEAETLAEAEDAFMNEHPLAAYYEIGFPLKEADLYCTTRYRGKASLS